MEDDMLKKVTLGLAIVLATLFVTSCPNPVSPIQGQTGILTVTVFTDDSRTIIPEIVANLDSISLVLSGPGGATRSGSFDLDESIVFTQLSVGTWNVQAQGINSSGAVIASAEEVTVINAGSNSLSLDLTPNFDGEGSFEVSVSYPDSISISKVEGRVTPYGQAQGPFETIATTGSTFTFEKTNLPAGYYLMEVNLFEGPELKAGLYEILWIVNGTTTQAALVLSIDDMELPLAPTEFEALSVENGMELSWIDNSVIETSYSIERSLDGISYSPLSSTPSSATSYTDGNVEDGVEYFYRIKAVGMNGDSPWVSVSEVYTAGGGETGDLNITLTIVDPQDLADIFQALGDLGAGVVTVNSVVPGATAYSWRIDGVEVGTSSSYSLNPATLSAGLHTLSLVVTVNGSVYSETAEFVVDESPITQTPVLVIEPLSIITWIQGEYEISPMPAGYYFQGEGTIYLELTMSSALGVQSYTIETTPDESLVLPIPTFTAPGTVDVSYSFEFYATAEGKDPSATISQQETVNYTVQEKPETGLTVYVYSADGAPTVWAWFVGGSAVSELEGMSWPGNAMESDGGNWYKWKLPAAYEADLETTELSFHLDGVNTVIHSLSDDGWLDASGEWLTVDPRGPAAPTVTISPSGGTFQTTRDVTITFQDNGATLTNRSYTVDGVTTISATDTVQITLDGSSMSDGDTVTVSASATNSEGTGSAGPAVFTKSERNYDIPETLGALYTPSKTVFRIWSPDSSNVTVDIAGSTHNLVRISDFNGYTDVYEAEVPGDHHLSEYQLKVNGIEVRDPYGVMVIPNTNTNIVMDPKAIEPDGGWAPKPVQVDREDAIIYEVHIRDFTIDGSWNGSEVNRGKFLGMVEGGTTYSGVTTGIDHLVEMGVTHVQILPFYDFATPHYNWGYDPNNYNIPEEQYSATPTDYVNRIKEVMTMVNEFHKRGIRVIMDVVYNHTYGDEMFENITTKYFTGTNDSGTGNGINTGIPMVSRMIRDSLEYWIDVYNIDGYRFDLIGIFHYDEVRKWGEHINSVFAGDNILMYGEPWNGYWPDPNEGQKVRLGTTRHLASGHVGVFNGAYREALKGGNDDTTKNYMFNQNEKGSGSDGGWAIFDGMRGSPYEAGGPHSDQTWGRNFAADPEQTINYISAHDNFGIWDKAYISLASDVTFKYNPDWGRDSHQVIGFTAPSSATLEYAERVVRFGTGIILTSQGIPFLHAGDEFLRTKTNNADQSNPSAWAWGDWYGTHNTYNSPDSFNKIRWGWKTENASHYDYNKALIALRRQYEGFRMTTNSDIASYMTADLQSAQVITGYIDYPSDSHRIFMVYNSGDNQSVTLPSGNWTLVADTRGAQNQPGLSGTYVCEGTSVTVFTQQK
jgi:pullulanase